MTLLFCPTDWWQFGATMFTGLAMAGVTWYWSKRQYISERRAKFQSLIHAVNEIEVRTRMLGLVAMDAIEGTIEPNDGLQSLKAYNQFTSQMMINLGEAHEEVSPYLTDEKAINFEVLYDLCIKAKDLQRDLGYVVQQHDLRYITQMPPNAKQEYLQLMQNKFESLKKEVPNPYYNRTIDTNDIAQVQRGVIYMLHKKHIQPVSHQFYVEREAMNCLTEFLSITGCYEPTLAKLKSFTTQYKALFGKDGVKQQIEKQITSRKARKK